MKAYYRITITVLCISLLICLLSFSSAAADSVTEEIPVTWRWINAVSSQINYCSQNIYYFRQGGNTPIDVVAALTNSYKRYYGLLTQRINPISNPRDQSLTLNTLYWYNNHPVNPNFEYIFGYSNFNLTSSNYPLSSSPIYFIGTSQPNFATWKSKIELNAEYSVSDYYAGNNDYSFPSLVVLRLFADIDIDKLTEFDYINFAYDYTTFYPDGDSTFDSKVNSLFSDSNRYAASIGYTENGYYVPIVYSDSQFTSFARFSAGVDGDGVTTTQSIDFNLPNIVNVYNDRFSLNLTVDEFKQSFPSLTVACSYWHVVFDYVDNGLPVASLQYFGRYSLPVVYLSNYNPVTVAISQVNQRLDQLSDNLFIVQDSGDVQIINNLENKLAESTGVVSDFDSAVAALDSIIGSVQPETNVIKNAFSTGEGATGAGVMFSQGIDIKEFLAGEYILPLFVIAISVSLISWVIYGKHG